MRILIDAMGGDNAPGEIVRGAVDARREFGTDITLFGQSDKVRPILAECGADSSMAMALKALHLGEGDAMISAGSTGALLSGATLIVRRVRGIRRACFGPVLPNGKNGVLLIDSGANAECTPEYLLQFAYMGSFYSREILGCAEPRVGLLNIGAEESKGTPLQKETYELLRREDEAGRLRFIGNVEARDALFGGVDVLVTDGFSGNILLKGIEGTAVMLMKELKKIFYKNTKNKLAAAMLKNDVYALKALLDPSEVGGTALLGISKPVIKAHGSSDARAVRSAVKQAITFMNAGVIESIEKNIAYMRVGKED